MTGQVLDYSVQTNEGIISGADGVRYTFPGAGWPAGAAPVRGTPVDFEVRDGNRAVGICLIETDAPAAASPGTTGAEAGADAGCQIQPPLQRRGDARRRRPLTLTPTATPGRRRAPTPAAPGSQPQANINPSIKRSIR